MVKPVVKDGTQAAHSKKSTPKQMKYYRDQGVLTEIVDLSLYYFRLYLITCDGFPPASEQRRLAALYYRIASKATLGTTWKGVFSINVLFLRSHDHLLQRLCLNIPKVSQRW